MEGMDFEIWFTPQSMQEADRIVRRWYFWPLFLIGNVHGIAVIVALFVIGIGLLVKSFSSSPPELAPAAVGLLVASCPIVGFAWFYWREKEKSQEELAAINPAKLTITADGVQISEKDGACSFVPWCNLDGFREGKTVILVRDARSSRYLPLPKNTVPLTDVERLKSAIRSRLPEIS